MPVVRTVIREDSGTPTSLVLAMGASLLAALLASACLGDQEPANAVDGPPIGAAAVSGDADPATTAVFLRSPADGDTVPSTFTVVFGLRNYGVAPAGVNMQRTGHFHVLVDAEAPPVGAVIPADANHRHYGMGQIETQLTLLPGEHTLRAVLGDHAHAVLDSLVGAPVRIVVRPQP
jgi:hypothetical protein